MPVSTRRGRNHASRFASIWACCLVVMYALAPMSARAQATPEDNPFVQRGVPAEATAENAVVARDRALISGQRIAYERMASQRNLPLGLSDQQIEAMVQSLVIENERITTGRYTARITVNFNPGGVARSGGAGAAAPAHGTGARPGAQAVATVDALARYGSFREWLELNRRLSASAQVTRVEVVTISGQMARLRIGLRAEPASAISDLAAGGLALGPAPMGAPPGEGWRLSLAGIR